MDVKYKTEVLPPLVKYPSSFLNLNNIDIGVDHNQDVCIIIIIKMSADVFE